MTDTAYEVIEAQLRPCIPDRCAGCSTTELRLSFAVLHALRSETPLEDQIESFNEQMQELEHECRYGAATPSDGSGEPECRIGVLCEFPPRPSITDEVN